ncbi:MAG: hypothetical protein EXQ97_05535 [Alphaproteobacteria bacterium]|nr:hypothetical protein [Alphaproteobacteria bacterium]
MTVARIGTWALAAALPLLHGLLVLAFDMDANWDLRNYHFYNAYAWIGGRSGHDLLVASAPTFFNPLIDLPFYRATELWPARTVGVTLGIVQGLNAIPVFGLAAACLASPDGTSSRGRLALAFAVTVLAGCGSIALSLVGTTFYDNVVTLGGLAGLWLVVAARVRLARGGPAALALAAVAGIGAGLAMGLKQPAALYVAGLGVAVLAMPGSWRLRAARTVALGCGALAGFAATGGAWMLHLWRAYGNPVFPFYNHLFRSPWALHDSYKHLFYLPDTLWERLLYPIAYTRNTAFTSDVDFQDYRILSCFVLLPMAASFMLWRRLRGRAEPPALLARDAALPVMAFWAGTYVAWVALFGIYRYALALEMLAPLVLLLAWDRILHAPARRLCAAGATIVVVVATMQLADWGRVPWTARWVDTRVPDIARPDATLVLLAGHEPYGFLVPAFPPAVRFLRIDGGFTTPAQTEVRFNDVMRDIVEAHAGDIFTLNIEHDRRSAANNFAIYGLTVDFARCQPVTSSIGIAPYELCPATR